MRLFGRARLVALVLLVALLGAACVEPLPEDASDTTVPDSTEPDRSDPDDTDPDDTDPDPSDPGVPDNPRPDLPPGVPEVLAELGGRWAIGRGHDVVVLDLADLSEVTLDGSADVVARQPTWSTDGSLLAWTVIDSTEPANPFQVRRGDGAEPWDPATIYPVAGVPLAPFYLQWGGNGDLLALGPATTDEPAGPVALRYIDPAGTSTAIGFGGPIWIDWNGDGSQALVHWDDAAIGVFDPTIGAAISSVVESSHVFGPAAWVDEGTFLAGADGALATYAAADGSVSESLLDAGRFNSFVLNAEGTQVAFRHWLASELDAGDERLPFDAPLRVLDLGTGELSVVTDVPVLAWEWSPDGTRLAYLADAKAEGIQTVAWRQETDGDGEAEGDPDDDPTADDSVVFDWSRPVRWHFWGDDVLLNATSPFVVTNVEALEYLPFFEQYALSHTRWSPEGDAFVFAGSVSDDLGAVRTGVHVQFVDFLTDSIWITDGDVAWWSPTGGGGAGTSPF